MTGPHIGTLGVLLGVTVAAGVLDGRLGVGSGGVIVPALYVARSAAHLGEGIAMQVAVATSLTAVVFTVWLSSRAYDERGSLDGELLRSWALRAVLGVVLGSLLSAVIDGRMIAVVVASLLTITVLLCHGNPAQESRRTIPAPGVSAMMGIGGGTVRVSVLSHLGYYLRRAAGGSALSRLVSGAPRPSHSPPPVSWRSGGPLAKRYFNVVAIAVIAPFASICAEITHAIPMRTLRTSFGPFLAVTARMFINRAAAA